MDWKSNPTLQREEERHLQVCHTKLESIHTRMFQSRNDGGLLTLNKDGKTEKCYIGETNSHMDE